MRPTNILLATLLLLAQPTAIASDNPNKLAQHNQERLNSALTEHLKDYLRKNPKLNRDPAENVSVQVNPKTGIITINLSRYFLPENDPVENEDLEELLGNEIYFLVENELKIKGLLFRYEGRSIHDFFPKQERPTIKIDLNSINQNQSSTRASAINPIVISAGHGQYHDYKHGWTAQRKQFFGMTEDYITPVFAKILSAELENPFLPRSQSEEIHTASGVKWKNVGARYYLENMFPTRNDVWNSYSIRNPNQADRERRDDIYSRPLIANAMNARALISLHTNAGTPSARGTRVYYYPGRQKSHDLAERILCSMKEVIRAKPNYAEWPIVSEPYAQDHAENRAANPSIPAVIVEVGFHTNAEDAAIMQTPTFQEAAMRGVAKGLDLHDQEKDCEELEITHIPAIAAHTVKSFSFEIHFKGNPTSDLFAYLPNCGGGIPIYGCQKVQISTRSPAVAQDFCIIPGTTTRKITLKDGDGVLSNTAEYTVTCL